MTSDASRHTSVHGAADVVEAFIEYAPIGFALLDRDLRFIRVNERMAEMNGVPAAAHVGLRPQDILPGIPAESYLPVIKRALAGEPSEAVELTGETSSRPGVTRWWLESWSPVRGSSGEVIAAAAFVVEITERKLAELRMRDSEARELEHAEALAALAAGVAQVVTVPELAAVVANVAPKCVAGAFANVAIAAEPGDRLRLFHGETLDTSIAERWREIAINSPAPLAEAVRTAAPVFVRSPEDNARRYPSLAADTERAGLAATASVPLLDRGGRVLGAMGFAWHEPQEFGPALRARLRTVAELVAQSLRRTRFYEAERREAERVSLMADVIAAVGDGASVNDGMSRMCSVLVPQFADLAIAVLASDEDGGPGAVTVKHRDAAAAARVLESVVDDRSHPAELRLPVLVSAQHVPDLPEVLGDADVGDPRTLELLRSVAARSYAGAPLRAGNRVVGSLIVANTSSGRRLDAEDLSFVAQLGERAGLLLDNRRLAEAKHEIADELQRRLLPSSLTAPASVRVAARYRPAHARLGVGGDWYDVAELPDGRLAIAVGDVVGHGARAAAAMGQLRSAFAALAITAGGPAELLHQLDMFATRTSDARFGTVCLAVLDPANGMLRYACAGHPPPLALHPDGDARFLDAGRSPPIAVEVGPRPDARATLAPGARLLLYTDGLIERRAGSIDAGLTHLVDIGRRNGGLALEQFCDAVLAQMPAAESTVDDIALLCVELVGGGAQ